MRLDLIELPFLRWLLTSCSNIPAGNQGGDDGVQDVVQSFAGILREEPEHEVFILLEEYILSPVPPIRFRIRQMLWAVQFDDDTSIRAEEIHFHPAEAIEWNWQVRVQPKAALGFRQSFEPAIEEGFAGTASAIHSIGVWKWCTRGMHKQIRQSRVHTIPDQPANAGCVIFLPAGIDRRTSGGQPGSALAGSRIE